LPWWRRKKAEEVDRRTPLQRELQLDERVALLERTSAKLTDATEQLDQQFRALRGYVYVKKGIVGPAGSAPPGEPEIPTPPPRAASVTSKDDLRRSLVQSGRFVPGQRPIHSEEK